MKQMICAGILSVVVLLACNKKEPPAEERTVVASKQELPALCSKEIITDKPVKVGETGMMLPAGSKICISKDNLEVRVELPEGFAFLSKDANAMERTLPYFGTYACYCSGQGSACNVFYTDGLGFGCLQSSCTGACTGKFTYKGYSVDNIMYQSGKDEFFKMPAIQETIASIKVSGTYSKQSLYGVPFYLVKDEKEFLSKAACDCEGTAACKLKVVTLQLAKGVFPETKIYYCEGGCNGCELTVK